MKNKYILYGTTSLSIMTALNGIDEVNAFNNREFPLNKEIRTDFKNIKTGEEIVNIEDENLLKAINNQLGRGEVLDAVTIEDIEGLTTLKASNKGITSIKGIEKAINLTSLDLSENRIVDVSYLSSLTELKTLYLYDNQISSINGFDKLVNLENLYLGQSAKRGNLVSDLTPIKDLTSLKKLHLGRNNISDLSLLSNLTTLTELYIECNSLNSLNGLDNLINLKILDFHGNSISNIESIKNLTNLTTLYGGKYYGYYGSYIHYGNQISDISPLENLTSLTTLYLNNNQISDISLLENLTSLKDLRLYNNQISGISSLENLTSLTTLYLNNNQISDISALENLTSLTNLPLYNNQIKDISALENLTRLTTLQLHTNQISDISSLENLTNLTNLQLGNNQIKDISVLENLTSLTRLELYTNQISDISSLENLTSLTFLHLANNQISDITSLENLTNLTTLYLHNNQISDISALENLTNLKDLRLYNNQISDISVLENLTNLTTLYLYTNQIKDISSLENLTSLTYLQLGNNQIKDISALENLISLTNLPLYNNQIKDISALDNLTNLTGLRLDNNQISDISSLENLTSLTNLNITNQKPNITTSDFKTEFNSLDINTNNPLVGLNNNFNISNISNRGVYKNNQLKWNNLSLGSHSNTFNFSQEVKIGSATSTFSGTATINFNIIDGGAPESDHTSEFDENEFEIYATVTATDLGEGVSHLIHKGIEHQLPYRFKYDVYDNSNNIVEVYDLAGNKEEYQVKLKESDIPTIDTGLDALINKDIVSSNDIKYFRTIVNDLDESSNKDLLQDKLNSISTTDTLERKTATANLDLYIKSENMLSMNLSTNSIVFEDFSGVEDLEKSNAIQISINSSLPYQLNSYLISEIQNADKSKTIDKSLLNIKESNSNDYKTFANINEKLVLKDDCSSGNGNIHNIDLRLNGSNAHTADIYKTVIKIEAEQK